MVFAFDLLKNAFFLFWKNSINILSHSVLFVLSFFVLSVFLLITLFALSSLSFGFLSTLSATGVSFSLALIGGFLVLLLLSLLFLAWLLSGTLASFVDSFWQISAGKSQSLLSFFTFIPSKATSMLLALLAQAAAMFLLPAAFLALAWFFAGKDSIFLLLALAGSLLYIAAIKFLSAFLCASVADGKGGAKALAASAVLVASNILPTAAFYLSMLLLLLPALVLLAIPLALGLFVKTSIFLNLVLIGSVAFAAAYVFLFFLPYAMLANILLYRKLKSKHAL
ncbi:MAG: hypothetical protein N3G80_03145 [Candidatus Micrarchaeota archaeon]|nr:hypothetical protein [Candidatus Micrarchaeota archaeon]